MLGSLQESNRVRHKVVPVGKPPAKPQYRVELYISPTKTEYAPCKDSEPAALLSAQAYLDSNHAGRTL